MSIKKHVLAAGSKSPAVNFINVKRANFSYENLFWQLFKLHFGFDERAKAHSYVKFARLTLMKLTPDRKTRIINILVFIFRDDIII